MARPRSLPLSLPHTHQRNRAHRCDVLPRVCFRLSFGHIPFGFSARSRLRLGRQSAVIPCCGMRRPSPWASTKLNRTTVADCFVYRIWIIVRERCSTASDRRPRAGCTSMPSTNSSPGTVRNRAWRSTAIVVVRYRIPGITRSGRKHH